jgi:hypothetical protein
MKSYLGNSTLQKFGYSYINEHKYYLKEKMVEDNGVMPIFVIDIIKEDDFINRLLDFENSLIYGSIENEISSLDKKDKIAFITMIYDEIVVLLKRISKFEHLEINLVHEKILELLTNLKDRYSMLVGYHLSFNYLRKITDVSFFKDRDLKYSFYVELYEIAYELNLIDDTEIEEIDFINAFTSSTPQTLKNKVRFSVNNYILSYFLESLKPFFNDFTHVNIESSKVFLNKQNKPITSGDIYTSLSRGKNKIEYEKNKIDEHILKLKKKFLK